MALKESGAAESPLSGFQFSNDDEFFGIPAQETEESSQTVIRSVKEGKTAGQESTDIDSVPKGFDDEEDDEETTSFFGVGEENEDKPKKTNTKKTETTTTTKKPVEAEVEEEDETDEEEEEVAVETKKKKKEETEEGTEEGTEEKDSKFWSTLGLELKEKGIFQNVEIKEDEEIDEDKFFELQDAEIEARVDETFQAFAEELDEDGKAYIKFKKNGGKTSDFISQYAVKVFDLDKLDETDESQLTKVLTHYITSYEKLDGEELADRLTWLKESGKQKAYAIKWFETIKKDDEERRETLVKAQETIAKKREEASKEFNNLIIDTINKTQTVGAFPITEADRKELAPFMTKATVKVGKGKYVPQLQVELSRILRGETEQDRQDFIILSKLIKRKFDITDLVQTVKTKVVKGAKSKLQEAKTGIKPSGTSAGTKRSLSDYFG